MDLIFQFQITHLEKDMNKVESFCAKACKDVLEVLRELLQCGNCLICICTATLRIILSGLIGKCEVVKRKESQN